MKDLNVRFKTIKPLEENIGNSISDISLRSIFSDVCPQARETKEKNKQMGLRETKKFLHNIGNI